MIINSHGSKLGFEQNVLINYDILWNHMILDPIAYSEYLDKKHSTFCESIK